MLGVSYVVTPGIQRCVEPRSQQDWKSPSHVLCKLLLIRIYPKKIFLNKLYSFKTLALLYDRYNASVRLRHPPALGLSLSPHRYPFSVQHTGHPWKSCDKSHGGIPASTSCQHSAHHGQNAVQDLPFARARAAGGCVEPGAKYGKQPLQAAGRPCTKGRMHCTNAKPWAWERAWFR